VETPPTILPTRLLPLLHRRRRAARDPCVRQASSLPPCSPRAQLPTGTEERRRVVIGVPAITTAAAQAEAARAWLTQRFAEWGGRCPRNV